MPFVDESSLEKLLKAAAAQGVSKTAIAKLRNVNQKDDSSQADEAPASQEATADEAATAEAPTAHQPSSPKTPAATGHGMRRQPPPPAIEL